MDDIEALAGRIPLIGKGKVLCGGSLAKIRERFDRKRRLELTFEPGEEQAEPEGTRLISHKESHAVWGLDTGIIGVSAALRVLVERLAVADMSAASRPIEEIIASLYQEGGFEW
jgi:ABC-2 type transport system ATP-binding protein